MTQHASELLEVRDVRTYFPIKKGILARTVGHIKAVDGVDLDIREGETVCVVGESGCGKSTLARTILRLEKPRTGTIKVFGKDISTLSGAELKEYRRTVQVVFQDPMASLNPRMTILETLTEGALAHGLVTHADARKFAAGLLKEVDLEEHFLDRYPHEFSGGQRQRICIARALALQPKLLICDEAVTALDVVVRAKVLDLLQHLRKTRSLAYLFITHDIGVVRRIASRVVVMYKGKIVETGSAKDVLDNPQAPYTKYLLQSVPVIGKPLPEATDRDFDA
ncbi:MAG: ABC transporter ATP-binding protein [Kiritimatiellae bacterium]|nr:ABC transporter ATP-binding protein [Kiritimatiellia bacterium]